VITVQALIKYINERFSYYKDIFINFSISYNHLKQIAISSSGIILTSISTENHRHSSCCVIKHVRCLHITQEVQYRCAKCWCIMNIDRDSYAAATFCKIMDHHVLDQRDPLMYVTAYTTTNSQSYPPTAL